MFDARVLEPTFLCGSVGSLPQRFSSSNNNGRDSSNCCATQPATHRPHHTKRPRRRTATTDNVSSRTHRQHITPHQTATQHYIETWVSLRCLIPRILPSSLHNIVINITITHFLLSSDDKAGRLVPCPLLTTRPSPSEGVNTSTTTVAVRGRAYLRYVVGLQQ